MNHNVLLFSCLCLATACGGPRTPTYFRDVKPLVDRSCAGCHAPGGIGPFPLTTYDEVKLYAGAMEAAVVDRSMPPWPAERGCTEYQDDASLTDDQIHLLSEWAALGAPAGRASDALSTPATLTRVLPRVDLQISMPLEYTPRPPPGASDDFRCFLVDWPMNESIYITGVQVRPGNPAVAHHLVSVLIPEALVPLLEANDAADPEPGFACGAGMAMNGMGMTGDGSALAGLGVVPLAVWAPGTPANVFPEGSGVRVPAGMKVLINMHYSTLSGAAAPDRTVIDVMTSATVEREGKSFLVGVPKAQQQLAFIPAYEADVVSSGTIDLTSLFEGRPVLVHEAGLHMHVRGKSGLLSVRREGGEECGVRVPKWDFGWQLGYRFVTPKLVTAADRVYLECHWDNSAEAQPTFNGVKAPVQNVTFGESTNQEMCLGFLFATPQ